MQRLYIHIHTSIHQRRSFLLVVGRLFLLTPIID